MDCLEYCTAIENFIGGVFLWIMFLPKWGMATVILLLSAVGSKLGLIASIAVTAIVWNVFGYQWGLLSLGADITCWLVVVGLAILTD